MTEVRVKKLEWERSYNSLSAPGAFAAHDGFGGVYAQLDRRWYHNRVFYGSEESDSLARDAAQADFERRVLSCLEMPNE